MIITDAIIFKNELKYHKHYEIKCLEILKKIDDIDELLKPTISSPLKSEDYWVYENYEFKKKTTFKSKGYIDEKKFQEYRNSLNENKERLIKKQNLYLSKLNDIKETLMLLDEDLRKLCERIYIKKESFVKIANELCYSSGNLHKVIDRRLREALETIS